MNIRLVIAVALLVAPTQATCEPRPNVPIVAAGEDGTCYAKSVPAATIGMFDRGSQGRTTIYRVHRDRDVPGESYNWFGLQLFVLCPYLDNGKAIVVARMGRFDEDFETKLTDVAIAFYKSGKLLTQYSVLDIAGSRSNIRGSISRYRPFSDVKGWVWMEDLDGKSCCSIFFLATTADGRQIRFSPYTGERIPDAPAK